MLTHKHQNETDSKNHNADLLQIWHNEPQVTLRHLLDLGVPVPTCASGFILLGPDMAGNLEVVLGHKREALWVCSDHSVQVREGKMTPSRMGWGPLMSD